MNYLAKITFILIALMIAFSLPVVGYGQDVFRSVGNDIGYCECACVDMDGEELCNRLTLDEIGPNTTFLLGECVQWELGYVGASISICDQLTGKQCDGFRAHPAGWVEGVPGRYHCHWSE